MGVQNSPLSTTFQKQETSDRLTLETSLPITLTTNPDSREPNAYLLPKQLTTDLYIYGDEVAIEGTIKAPSRTVRIVARIIKVIPSTAPKPITVDVAGQRGEAKQQIARKTLANMDIPGKGHPGARGSIQKWWPNPASDAHDAPGGNGEGADQNKDLNGADGEQGNAGQHAGLIQIICSHIRAASQPLTLWATGGNGGDGQQGQDGCDGGDGGGGADIATRSVAGFGGPTAGGNGGKGGKGGTGGTLESSPCD